MQKACLSLIFMSVLAYGTPENKKLTNKEPTHINVLEYLKAKRPVEQDFRTRHTIPAFAPYIGGKQCEVNWSQLDNVAGTLGGGMVFCYDYNRRPLSNMARNGRIVELNMFDHLRPIFPALSMLYFAYRYFNGEQKNPFRIIDEPKTISTEESDQ